MERSDVVGLGIAFLKKWLFPDFTNKLTWFVVSVGVGILVTPSPLKLVFYNWVIETLNLNSGVPFTLADLNADSAGSIYGFLLIAFGLLHNIAYKYFSSAGNIQTVEKNNRHVRADTALYEKFVNEFSSNSGAAIFLRDHDLGNSYEGAKTRELEDFYNNWNTAETTFLTTTLEKKKMELWMASKAFLNELASVSGVVNGNVKWFSVIPEQYMGHFDYPDFVTKRVKKLNDMATHCHQVHQELIALCKEELKC